MSGLNSRISHSFWMELFSEVLLKNIFCFLKFQIKTYHLHQHLFEHAEQNLKISSSYNFLFQRFARNHQKIWNLMFEFPQLCMQLLKKTKPFWTIKYFLISLVKQCVWWKKPSLVILHTSSIITFVPCTAKIWFWRIGSLYEALEPLYRARCGAKSKLKDFTDL